MLDASAASAPVLVTDMLETRRLNICCSISVAALYYDLESAVDVSADIDYNSILELDHP
jgi:hypothetical protein